MSFKPKAFHSYFGGKNRMSSFIVPYTPKGIKTYVEPFSGSFAVYFFTPLDNDVEAIYNDFNKDQANLVHCAKDYEKFLEKLDYHMTDKNGLLYCPSNDIDSKKEHFKTLYYDTKKSDFSTRQFKLGDYDRACMYAFLLTSAFNSVNYMNGGFSGFNKERMKLLTFINKLKDEYIRYKLDRITNVETMDFEELILKYDSPDTYFYIDPPYFTENKKDTEDTVDKSTRVGWYGAKDMFDKDSHKRLCDLLKTLKGKWSLSYYDFENLHEWLPEDEFVWKKESFFRSSASFSDNKDVKGEELLIMNYELTDEEIEDNKRLLEETKNPTKKTVKKTVTTKPVVEKKVKDYKSFNESIEDVVEALEDNNFGTVTKTMILPSKPIEDKVKKDIEDISQVTNKIVEDIQEDEDEDFWS